MSKTDRDRKWYFYKHHHEVCTARTRVGVSGGWVRYVDTPCVCNSANSWRDYSWHWWPTPSWFKKGQRRLERAQYRNEMQQGWRHDYANVAPKRGRDYYW